MFRRILVPLDGSKTAEVVMPYATAIANIYGSQIMLVSVSESAADASHIYETYLTSVASKFRRQLKEWGETDEQYDVQNKVLVGNPALEIVGFASKEKISIIVMASRGSSGEGPWLLGHIAAKVLRTTDRPVLLVRTPASDAALEQKKLVRKILVPLDGSKAGESALCYAERLAKTMSAEIVLIEVFEPVGTIGASGIFYTVRDDEAVRRTLMGYLDTIAQPIKEQGIKVSSVVAFGNPASQIMKYAEENSVDLITISSHGRSGMGRWVFGNVTDKILHTGDVAVLVVRTSEASCDVILSEHE
ncbi:MAG: universal stress protein [Dehalococcoidales bacterium]|nr:universal stress protein [Dehalococcoidales bacterium]